MKISMLVKILSSLEAACGDVEVWIVDYENPEEPARILTSVILTTVETVECDTKIKIILV